MLAVDILELRPRDWGWTALIPGFGLLSDEFTEPWLRISEVDAASGSVRFGDDITLPYEPFPGTIGVARILSWQALGWYDYGTHHRLVAGTVGAALVGVVTFGSLTGSMLPFVLRRLGFDPASASAPFVATLVDVTGIVIYFTIAALMLRGTLL